MWFLNDLQHFKHPAFVSIFFFFFFFTKTKLWGSNKNMIRKKKLSNLILRFDIFFIFLQLSSNFRIFNYYFLFINANPLLFSVNNEISISFPTTTDRPISADNWHMSVLSQRVHGLTTKITEKSNVRQQQQRAKMPARACSFLLHTQTISRTSADIFHLFLELREIDRDRQPK